uniref:XRN 5'-3' exonuclease N-terminus domain-containing protein, putative n=1 Tax=Neospora caninum (strain Liverpool) TaxID=572307 RepID=A0A0F7UJR7_NEOCL|nr:TPA: XRN 5'-3' exonuclease N-terminus domain-containing protein, putative [Neospora caninum Liverpool]
MEVEEGLLPSLFRPVSLLPCVLGFSENDESAADARGSTLTSAKGSGRERPPGPFSGLLASVPSDSALPAPPSSPYASVDSPSPPPRSLPALSSSCVPPHVKRSARFLLFLLCLSVCSHCAQAAPRFHWGQPDRRPTFSLPKTSLSSPYLAMLLTVHPPVNSVLTVHMSSSSLFSSCPFPASSSRCASLSSPLFSRSASPAFSSSSSAAFPLSRDADPDEEEERQRDTHTTCESRERTGAHPFLPAVCECPGEFPIWQNAASGLALQLGLHPFLPLVGCRARQPQDAANADPCREEPRAMGGSETGETFLQLPQRTEKSRMQTRGRGERLTWERVRREGPERREAPEQPGTENLQTGEEETEEERGRDRDGNEAEGDEKAGERMEKPWCSGHGRHTGTAGIRELEGDSFGKARTGDREREGLDFKEAEKEEAKPRERGRRQSAEIGDDPGERRLLSEETAEKRRGRTKEGAGRTLEAEAGSREKCMRKTERRKTRPDSQRRPSTRSAARRAALRRRPTPSGERQVSVSPEPRNLFSFRMCGTRAPLPAPASFSSPCSSSLSSSPFSSLPSCASLSDHDAFKSRRVSRASLGCAFGSRAPVSAFLSPPVGALRFGVSRFRASSASACVSPTRERVGWGARRGREASCASAFLSLGGCPPRNASFSPDACASSFRSSLRCLSARGLPPRRVPSASETRSGCVWGEGASSTALGGVPHLYKWLCRHFPSLKRSLHEFAELYVPPVSSAPSLSREAGDHGDEDTAGGKKQKRAKGTAEHPRLSVTGSSSSPPSSPPAKAADPQAELAAAVERAVATAPRMGRERGRRGGARALAPQTPRRREAHVAAMQEVLRLKEQELLAAHRRRVQEPSVDLSSGRPPRRSSSLLSPSDSRLQPQAPEPPVLSRGPEQTGSLRDSAGPAASGPSLPGCPVSPASSLALGRPVPLSRLHARLPIDALFLDFNAIIHLCSHGHLPSTLPPPLARFLPLLLQRVCGYLHRLVSLVRPRKLLVLTLDGVPPLAKVTQQRSRRFRQSRDDRLAVRLEDEEEEDGKRCGLARSACCLPRGAEGPGEQTLKKFIVHKLRTSPLWRHLHCVCLNTHSVPGEGEHKLLHLLRFGTWPEAKSLPHTLPGAGPTDGPAVSLSSVSSPAFPEAEPAAETGRNPERSAGDAGKATRERLLRARPPGLRIVLPSREDSEPEKADGQPASAALSRVAPAPSVASPLGGNAPAGLIPPLPAKKKGQDGAHPLSRLERRQREARPLFLSSFLHSKFRDRAAEAGSPPPPGDPQRRPPERGPLASDADQSPSAGSNEERLSLSLPDAQENSGLEAAGQVALPGRVCLYGMDADLLMLTLSLHRSNLLILRERQTSLERTRAQAHAEAVARARVNPHRAAALFASGRQRGRAREEIEEIEDSAACERALLVPTRHDFLQYTSRDFEVVDVDALRGELLSGLRRAIANGDPVASPQTPQPEPAAGGRRDSPEKPFLAGSHTEKEPALRREQASKPKAPASTHWLDGRRVLGDGRFLDPERLIDDFVFLSFFVGNDFLPGLPHLDIFQGGLATLVRTYTAALPALGGYLTLKTKINLERLRRLFQILALYEGPHFESHIDSALLQSIARAQAGLSCGYREDARRDDLLDEAKRRIRPLLANAPRAPPRENGREIDCTDPHAVLYYTSKFPLATLLGRPETRANRDGPSAACPASPSRSLFASNLSRSPWAVPFADFRARLALDYVTGLFFLLRYYHTSKPCWSWFFPHEFAPLCSDLARLDPAALARSVALPSVREDFKFSPYAQLLAVLPASSAALLPRVYRHLPRERELADMFPDGFPVDSHPFHALRFDFKQVLEDKKEGQRSATDHDAAALPTQASSAFSSLPSSLFSEMDVRPASADPELAKSSSRSSSLTCAPPSPSRTSPSLEPRLDSRERDAIALALDAHADPRFLASALSAASAASLPSWLHRPILPPLDIPRLLEAARGAARAARRGERSKEAAGSQGAGEKGREAETGESAPTLEPRRGRRTSRQFSVSQPDEKREGRDARPDEVEEPTETPTEQGSGGGREQGSHAEREGDTPEARGDVYADKMGASWGSEEDRMDSGLWTLQDVLRNRIGKPVMFWPPAASSLSPVGQKRRAVPARGSAQEKRVSRSAAGVPAETKAKTESKARRQATGIFETKRKRRGRAAGGDETKKPGGREKENGKLTASGDSDGDRRAKPAQGQAQSVQKKGKRKQGPRRQEAAPERTGDEDGVAGSGGLKQNAQVPTRGRRRAPKRRATSADETHGGDSTKDASGGARSAKANK